MDKKVIAAVLLVSFLPVFGIYEIAVAGQEHKKVIEGHKASPGETALSTSKGQISVTEACEIISTAMLEGQLTPETCPGIAPTNPVCKLISEGSAKVCKYCTDGDVGHAIECIGLALAIIAIFK